MSAKKNLTINYKQVADLLGREGLHNLEPAQLHGMICGLVCTLDTLRESLSWIEIVCGALEAPQLFQKHEVLLRLYQDASGQLAHSTEMLPLLPDAKQPLHVRARALTDWCYGFVHGLALSGRPFLEELSDDIRLAVFHISEIANIDFARVKITRRDAQPYQEILGYIRSAASNIYRQLNPTLFLLPPDLSTLLSEKAHTLH